MRTNAPKPAEPPACLSGCKLHDPMDAECTVCLAYARSAEPQSEPPIYWENATKWAEIVLKNTPHPMITLEANVARAYLALRAERDALREALRINESARNEYLKAENAALKAELDHLKDGIPLTYNPNNMCRNGHQMVLFVSEFEPCPMCALKARVEELEKQAAEDKRLQDRAYRLQMEQEARDGK